MKKLQWETKTYPNGKTVIEAHRAYAGLEDQRGRVFGHRFHIWKWDNDPLFRVYTHTTRNYEDFGGASGNNKIFENLEDAKKFLESTVEKVEKATRKNVEQAAARLKG